MLELVLQVGGVLVGGLGIVALIRRSDDLGRMATGSIAVVIVVAVAALLVPTNLRLAVGSFQRHRDENAGLTPAEERREHGVESGIDVPFVSWAEERLGPDSTFALTTEAPRSTLIAQWTLFQLAPRLALLRPSEADWTVFYEVDPQVYSSPEYEALQVYRPGFAIARYRSVA